MRYIALATILALGVGCASAEQRLESRQGYRQAQVDAIKVQREADIQAAQALSAERVAMWEALSAAVQANPDAASHMAIVAAVASTGGSQKASGNAPVVKLNQERETTALDYVKVLTPGLIGGLTQAGIAAIVNETTRESIKANRDVRITEAQIDGKMWDVMNTGMAEDGDIYIIGGEASDQASDALVDDLFSIGDDPVVSDPPEGTDDSSGGDDSGPDDTTNTSGPDDVTDEDPDDTTDEPGDDGSDDGVLDCGFSPQPAGCV